MEQIIAKFEKYLKAANISVYRAEKDLGVSNGMLGKLFERGKGLKTETLEIILSKYPDFAKEVDIKNQQHKVGEPSTLHETTMYTDQPSTNIDQLSKSVLMAMEIIKKHAEALVNNNQALKINAEALNRNSETINIQANTMAEMAKKIPDSVKLPKGKTMADQPEFSSEIAKAKNSKRGHGQQR